MEDKVLYHHGVMGMRWGHRKDRLTARNVRLAKRANKFDKKSAVAYKKSEKLHAKMDLGFVNSAAKQSAKYAIKATKYKKKAAKAADPYKQAKLENKAAKATFKSSRWKTNAENVAKTVGYSNVPLAYALKASVYSEKADKARMKIANNKRIIAHLDKKISSIPNDTIDIGKQLVRGK